MPSRVLVVDGDRFTTAFARISLEQEGFIVDTAGSGREAQRRFSRNRPDLILVARHLPDIEGVDLAAQLRPGDSPPLLLLLPEGDEQEPEVTGCLHKPFGFDDLLSAVHRFISLM